MTIWRGVSDSVEVCVRSGRWMATALQLLDDDLLVGVDADIGRDAHRDLACPEGAVARQRSRGGEGVRAAGPNRDNPVVWLNEVAGARQQEDRLAVGDDHHGFESPEGTVGAPVAGELHGRTFEVSA